MLAAAAVLLPSSALASHLDGELWTFTTPNEHFLRSGFGFELNDQPVSRGASSTWSGRYLGTFGEETLTFTALDYLDTFPTLITRRMYLSFDLMLTRGWAGSYPELESVLTVVANQVTVLDASFAIGGESQSYPGTFPDDVFPGGTGRDFRQTTFPLTDVYHIDLVFEMLPPPNCQNCTDVSLAFSASFGPLFEELEEEFPGLELKPLWGIDNFVVSSTPIPEPATGVLMGLGMLALGGARRLSRRGAGPRRGRPHARRCRIPRPRPRAPRC